MLKFEYFLRCYETDVTQFTMIAFWDCSCGSDSCLNFFYLLVYSLMHSQNFSEDTSEIDAVKNRFLFTVLNRVDFKQSQIMKKHLKDSYSSPI